jgi:hypothetical protein
MASEHLRQLSVEVRSSLLRERQWLRPAACDEVYYLTGTGLLLAGDELDTVLVTAIVVPVTSDEPVVTVNAEDVVAGSVTPSFLFDSVALERSPCGLSIELSGGEAVRLERTVRRHGCPPFGER